MNEDIKESVVVCPKCKSNNLTLIELSINHSIVWEQIEGKIDKNNGNVEPLSRFGKNV